MMRGMTARLRKRRGGRRLACHCCGRRKRATTAASVGLRGSVLDLGLDEHGEVIERLLPAEITGLDRDGRRQALLDDVDLRADRQHSVRRNRWPAAARARCGPPSKQIGSGCYASLPSRSLSYSAGTVRRRARRPSHWAATPRPPQAPLLGSRRERPASYRATEKRDELAASHSILIGAREQRGRNLPAGPIPEGS